MENKYMPEGYYPAIGNKKYSDGLSGLERAMTDGAILEGTVMLCDSDLNLHVKINGYVGIIPKSEVIMQRLGDEIKDVAIITRVGKAVCFKVTSIDTYGDNPSIFLSRRAAQADCFANYIKKLIPGDIIPAKVTHLEPFGAFTDIGCGIVSLLPVDCISISRISHPCDRISAGMQIYAVVKSFDREADRISLSMRELLGNWEQNAALFRPGQTVTGIIRSVESYGVFVELTPNLAGLAEAHSLDRYYTDEHSLPHPAIGKTAAVFIKSINPERMKIKLVIVDSCPADPRQKELHFGNTPSVPKYYIDFETVKHIDRWVYSPAESFRTVESIFA